MIEFDRVDREVVALGVVEDFPEGEVDFAADDNGEEVFCLVDVVVGMERDAVSIPELVEFEAGEIMGCWLDDEADVLISLEVLLGFTGDREVWVFEVDEEVTVLFELWLWVFEMALVLLVESVEAFPVLVADVKIEERSEEDREVVLDLDEVLLRLELLDRAEPGVEASELIAVIVCVI